jgi:predicted site-specific integrase-resolvase
MEAVRKQSALLTPPQARAILGVSKQSMQRLLKAGALEPVHIAGLGWPRYRRADVERLVREGRAP